MQVDDESRAILTEIRDLLRHQIDTEAQVREEAKAFQATALQQQERYMRLYRRALTAIGIVVGAVVIVWLILATA